MDLSRIVSGGQSGADIGAIDAAAFRGLKWGGYIPKGYRTDCGPLYPEYQPFFTETKSKEYSESTRKNIETSNATLLFVVDGRMGRGSKLTQRLCKELNKPLFIVPLTWKNEPSYPVASKKAIEDLLNFMREVDPYVLNVAGPRESDDNDMEEVVRAIIYRMLESLKIGKEKEFEDMIDIGAVHDAF